MKPIVFDTVIDGVVYIFETMPGPDNTYLARAKWPEYPHTIMGTFADTEEKAILKLVKLIEK